ncbi:membrane protein YoeI [Klebsiella pneumoniae]
MGQFFAYALAFTVKGALLNK